MEASLDDAKDRHQYEVEREDLKISFPLNRCLAGLKEKHLQVSKVHKERFEQVKKIVLALESYSSHLESSFIKIALPPTSNGSSIPATFDLSPTYITALDDEFVRVYEEYTRRVATVKALAENIVQLWAELGTPQAQTDTAIVQFYRDSPEQLGLHEDDINRLRAKRDKLNQEKTARERRLKELKVAVEGLWDRLGIEEKDRKQFLNSNRGCGIRQINEFEDELVRLNELKRQNLHLFVEDARCRLQELWDGLYFSEEEMLEFTPAFSDVYSDALLSAHEQEIARLEALKEQRAPTLTLIDRHRELVKERNDLQAASQDASRLMMRGQKGEKRDPTRLLREEKMRKRIAKELPKVAAELRKVLEKWEDEYGRPFLVHGERYLDELDASEVKPPPGPRSRTPAPGAAAPAASTVKPQKTATAPTSRPQSVMRAPPPRSKTPGPHDTLKRNIVPPSVSTAGGRTPSKIPSRAPLSNLKHANNSPERRHRPQIHETDTVRLMGPPKAPPPKMRDLFVPPVEQTPVQHFRSASVESMGGVRHVEPEDVYDDRASSRPVSVYDHRPASAYDMRPTPRHGTYSSSTHSTHADERFSQVPIYPYQYHHLEQHPAPGPPSRQLSNTSHATATTSTTVSGSENWETYDDASEPEQDATDAYYAKLRAARGKREQPYEYVAHQPGGVAGGTLKKQKGFPPPHHILAGHGHAMVMEGGDPHAGQTRIVSGSETGWTDEDAF
jgi:protein regulator of cytokinesis 1